MKSWNVSKGFCEQFFQVRLHRKTDRDVRPEVLAGLVWNECGDVVDRPVG